MRCECENYHGRQLEICEGTANLPAGTINAYRVRWGLEPLPEDQITGRPSELPQEVQLAVAKARAVKTIRTHGQRPINAAAIKQPTRRPSKQSGGHGCCGGGHKTAVKNKPKPNGYGPGSQLLKLWSDMPHCAACEALAARMDAWGKAGCTAHLDEIVADILPRAQLWMAENKPWFHKILAVTATEKAALRIGIAHKVRQAIGLATGK